MVHGLPTVVATVECILLLVLFLSRPTESSNLHIAERAGLGRAVYWSDIKNSTTFPDGHVIVPEGEVWYLDESMEAETLTILGSLKWDISKDGLEIRTAYMLVESGGYFQLGTSRQPMERNATIYITKMPVETHSHASVGYRFVAALGEDSRIDIHGRKMKRTWSLLSKDVQKGATELFLKHDPTTMRWRAGDRIGLVTTTQGKSTVHTISSIGPATEWKLGLNMAVSGHDVTSWEAAANVIDGQTRSYWASWCTNWWCTGQEQWIEVYLEKPANVTGVRINWDSGRYAPKFTIQGRSLENSDEWVTLATASATGGGWMRVHSIPGPNNSCNVSVVRLSADYESMKRRGEPAWAGLRVFNIEVYGRELNTTIPDVLHLADPVEHFHNGGIKYLQNYGFEMAAEVVNLERSVMITGDHEHLNSTHQGIHTALIGKGVVDMRYARVEGCGQRDNMGRYCLHFHQAGVCAECAYQGNAIVDSQQAAITIHGSHRTLIDQNIIWNSHAVGVYTEDGNEMYNMISQNVIVCPSGPLGCSGSWLGKGASQAGIYLIGMTNHLIENRIAAYENGIWTAGTHAPRGQGHADSRVCPQFTPFGTISGNVCHDNFRFGLYLDNQFPRNLERDADGFVTNPGSCAEFRPDGSDNGIEKANIIEDEFDYHNMFIGQYAMGDVAFVRYVSLNNAHSMYWKTSKNFADGVSHHIRDSIIANDPTDPYGQLQLFGPSGPFTFRFTNVTFIGSPVGSAALNAGQHCGLVGAGGPCNVQYHLTNISWTGLDPKAKRIQFGVHAEDDGHVLPIFLSQDGSLGGHKSLVSGHLKGFKQIPSCHQLSDVWDNAIACDSQIRRLNVWSSNLGIVNISGPGYVSAAEANMERPVNGMDAGMLPYEDNFGTTVRGYGAPVFVGGNYTVTGKWLGDVSFEFSDLILEELYGAREEIILNVSGDQLCTLHSGESRSFLSASGPGAWAADLGVGCKIVAPVTMVREQNVVHVVTAVAVIPPPEFCDVGEEVPCCPDGSCDETCTDASCCPSSAGRNTTCPSATADTSGLCSDPKAFDCTRPIVGKVHGECAFPNLPWVRFYWDSRCFIGRLGCLADGINPECRFCGDGFFTAIKCPAEEPDDDDDSPVTTTSTITPTSTTESTTSSTTVSTTSSTTEATTESSTSSSTTSTVDTLPSEALVRNMQTGLCLDVEDWASNGEDVWLSSCDGHENEQIWAYDADLNLMRTRNSGSTCMDAPEDDSGGSHVHMWLCDGSNVHQQWTFNRVTGQLSVHDGFFCAEAPEGEGKLLMMPCDVENAWQVWSFKDLFFATSTDMPTSTETTASSESTSTSAKSTTTSTESTTTTEESTTTTEQTTSSTTSPTTAQSTTESTTTVSTSEVPVASDRWILGGLGESCSQGCKALGENLECDAAAFKKHNHEVASKDKMKKMVMDLGVECTWYLDAYGSNPDVPIVRPSNGLCFPSSDSRSVESIKCNAKSTSSKRRLCYCAEPASPDPTKVPPGTKTTTSITTTSVTTASSTSHADLDVGQWVLGGYGETCKSGCESIGLACHPSVWQQHNNEIDTPDEMKSVVASLGAECADFNHQFGSNSDVPVVMVETRYCFLTDTDRPASTVSCSTGCANDRKRLCYCAPESKLPPPAPAPSPVFDDGRWLLAEFGESCTQGCSNAGLACNHADMFKHNNEIDTNDEMGSMVSVLGEVCTQFDANYGSNHDVPIVTSNGRCYRTARGRAQNSFGCSATSTMDKKRLCWCSGKDSSFAQLGEPVVGVVSIRRRRRVASSNFVTKQL